MGGCLDYVELFPTAPKGGPRFDTAGWDRPVTLHRGQNRLREGE